MSRPVFTTELFNDLRTRVVAHNRSGAPEVKIGEIKTLYKNHYRGANPGAAAMAKVDEHLTGLSKAFDESKHPRGNGGKFSGDMTRSLPATPEKHAKAMSENAGYRALQTDVIPERRGEAIGTTIRDVGSFGAGLGIAASVARGKENGLVRRTVGSLSGATTRLATAPVVHVAAGGAKRAIKDVMSRLPRPDTNLASRDSKINAASAKILDGAEKAGKAVGQGVVDAGTYAMRGLSSLAAASARTPIGKKGRRGLLIGLAGLPAGLAIHSALKGSILDPAEIGRGFDAFSYRQVRKLADDVDVGKALSLAKTFSGDSEVLEKAGGFYTRMGRGILAGAAGLVGGALGAGTGAIAGGAHESLSDGKGNPYHDEHGRFTSRSGAATGAIAGGALGAIGAGLGVFAALRSHNVSRAAHLARSLTRAHGRHMGAILSEEGHGAVKARIAGRAEAIEKAITDSKAVKDAVAQVERLGGSHASHYKNQIEGQVNEKIAEIASGHGAFEFGGKGGAKTVSDLKAAVTGKNADKVARDEVRDFVARATPAAFEKAIKNVKDPARSELSRLYHGRQGWKDEVDTLILQHHAGIDEATRASQTATEALAQARTAASLASDPATKASATQAVTAAEKAAREAQNSLNRLKSLGPDLKSPIPGAKLHAPTEEQINQPVKHEIDKARESAEKAFDKKTAELRAAQATQAKEIHTRNVAALSVLAEKNNVKPSVVTDALAGNAPAKKRLSLLPDAVRASMGQDLKLAAKSMRGASRDILERPTMKAVTDFAANTARRVKGAGEDVAHSLFFTKDGDKHRLHWGKVIKNATVIPTTGAIAVQYASDLKDYAQTKLTGTKEERRKARFPNVENMIAHDVNAITGAAYAAVTVPHPTLKGEKVILWGERYENEDSPARALHVGGKLSDVRGAFQNGRWQNQGDGKGGQQNGHGDMHAGPIDNMPDDVRGKISETVNKLWSKNGVEKMDAGPVKLGLRRKTDDNGINTEADQKGATFLDHMRSFHLNKGALEGGKYWGALKALFSRQGQILKEDQAFGILTNKRRDGNDVKEGLNPILSGGGFASNDAAAALKREVSRALTMNPSQEDKANLHRAVQVVARVKGLNGDTVRGIHDTIKSGNLGKANEAPRESKAPEKTAATPARWDEAELSNLTNTAAGRAKKHLEIEYPGSRKHIDSLIGHLAREANDLHGVGMHDAVNLAEKAVRDWGDNFGAIDVADQISSGHAEQNPELREHLAHLAFMHKGVGLDDFDVLLKSFGEAFSEALHPRVPTGPGGGEFASAGGAGGGHGSLGGKVAMEATEFGANKAAHSLSPTTERAPRGPSEFHPARLAPTLAQAAGSQAAWDLTGKFLKGAAKGATKQVSSVAAESGVAAASKSLALNVATRLLGGAGTAAKFGVQLAASFAGGEAGDYAATKGVEAAYRAVGSKAPKVTEAVEPMGRSLANAIGGTAGNILGGVAGAAGGPGGVFAGGVAGGVAGGLVGAKVYDWFSGYGDKGHAAMRRFSQAERV